MAILLMLVLMVAVFVASELLRPKPKMENARPSGLGDFRFPTATQGRVVPLIWGTVVLKGPNVVWYGDLKQKAIVQKIKTGLFSKKKMKIGYRYYFGMQLGLCRGEIDGVRGIWIGEKKVFTGNVADGTININEPELFGGDEHGSGGVVGTARVHPGTATQAVNSYLSGFQNIGGDTPRYSGTAYVVWEGGYHGNSSSVDAWKFEVRRIPNGLGLATPGVNGGNDANPMNVLYELMTNTEWGLGFPAADIDLTNFTAVASTLAIEGNGFSFVVDNAMEAVDLIQEIERQIDGFVFLDHRTGKWKVKLARDDYDIDTVPHVDEDHLLEMKDFSRGAWEDTTNQVRVQFANRLLDYNDDFAVAQDMANAMIQGAGTVLTGVNVSVTEQYPGVKDKSLANQIAWRELRALSYPLAKVTLIVDRSFWDVTPGDVIAWSDSDLGFTKMPMRVIRIDYGELRDGRILLECVQDVFKYQVGAFSDPPASNWEPPDDTLTAFPADEQIAFEAPRGIVFRDPDYSVMQDMIWASARQHGHESLFYMRERHSSGSPSGSFTEIGTGYAFLYIGELKNDLAAGTAIPTTGILITASPDSKENIESAFTDNPTIEDQGVSLTNLILIGNEFMMPRSASISGSDVLLSNVYRGILDSAQEAHSSGDSVWVVCEGGILGETTIPDGQNVEIKLIPASLYDELDEASATAISLTMDDRIIRPYPPSRCSLNGSVFPTTASLDYLSGGAESTGIDLDFIRRDYRTADGGDEIYALTNDAATIFSDFPSANSTTHEVEVRNDPDGSDTLLFTETGITGTSQDLLRIKILRYTDGVVPSRMRIRLKAKHNAGGKTGLYSRNNLTFDFNTTSGLSSKFNFGALDTDETSNSYTADAAGTHNFTLSSSMGGDVEYRLNGGSWTQLIASGNTTGSITGVAVSDTIEVRHRDSTASVLKQLDMSAPTGGTDAYAILYT